MDGVDMWVALKRDADIIPDKKNIGKGLNCKIFEIILTRLLRKNARVERIFFLENQSLSSIFLYCWRSRFASAYLIITPKVIFL